MTKGPLKLAGLLALAVGTLFAVPALATSGGSAPAWHTGAALPSPAPGQLNPVGGAVVGTVGGWTLTRQVAAPSTPTVPPVVMPTTDPPAPADTGNDDGSSDEGSVTPGAFCSTGGDTGHHGGHLYTCKGPGKLRWRR